MDWFVLKVLTKVFLNIFCILDTFWSTWIHYSNNMFSLIMPQDYFSISQVPKSFWSVMSAFYAKNVCKQCNLESTTISNCALHSLYLGSCYQFCPISLTIEYNKVTRSGATTIYFWLHYLLGVIFHFFEVLILVFQKKN